jgi:hypothetical protein
MQHLDLLYAQLRVPCRNTFPANKKYYGLTIIHKRLEAETTYVPLHLNYALCECRQLPKVFSTEQSNPGVSGDFFLREGDCQPVSFKMGYYEGENKRMNGNGKKRKDKS